VEEAPGRLPGAIPGLSAAVASVRLLWPEAQDGESGVSDDVLQGFGGGLLPRPRDGCPDGASRGASMCNVHGRVLLADSSLQTGGAEVLVTSTLVLDPTLSVAVVHGDIQVMALHLGDRRVCERRGDSA
jgi:hypothetical protein